MRPAAEGRRHPRGVRVRVVRIPLGDARPALRPPDHADPAVSRRLAAPGRRPTAHAGHQRPANSGSLQIEATDARAPPKAASRARRAIRRTGRRRPVPPPWVRRSRRGASGGEDRRTGHGGRAWWTGMVEGADRRRPWRTRAARRPRAVRQPGPARRSGTEQRGSASPRWHRPAALKIPARQGKSPGSIASEGARPWRASITSRSRPSAARSA